jgi:hypothetical protein
LALNLDKINIIKFKTNNLPQSIFSIEYDKKYIEESVNTQFLDLQTDNHLNWKNHNDQTIPKLSTACHAIRPMFDVSNTDTLWSIYFAYFYSMMKYGILFGGNLSNSKIIFNLQKRIDRIMASAKPKN